jgi:hypothetical protein
MDAISVPQGHVNLTDARHFYLERRFPNEDTINEQQQEEADDELIAAFRARHLNACIRHIGSESIDHLPDNWWNLEEWTDMIFVSPTIKSLTGWSAYNGLVPFVRRDELEKWVHAQTQPAPPSIPTGFDGILLDSHDPMTMPFWSLGMAIIWIMCRSPEDAAVYWRAPLEAAVFEFAVGEPTRRDITFETARDDLLSKLASDDLRATVIDENGESKELRACEWPHLKLQMDTDKDGSHFYLWRPGGLGGTSYHNIRLMRDDVLKIWPKQVDAPDSLDAPRKTIRAAEVAHAIDPGPTHIGQRRRSAPQAEKAGAVLRQLFPPDGQPLRTDLTDGEVVKLVQDKFTSGNVPSRDTVLRAAGRKNYPAKK